MLLPTKLFPPPLSGSLVDRPWLVARLMDGLSRPLTLVSAPAGFGKSTLLAGWAEKVHQQSLFRRGWLSLDAQDNTPAQFWAYFAAAWKSALPPADAASAETLIDQIHALLKSDEKSIAEQIVGALIQMMVAVPTHVLLVLDDYHLIQNPEIHAGLSKLIERLPPNIRLAVATRFDPPLPIPRLRVREQVTEIRAADLRFQGAEIAALLQKIPGVAFTEADVAAIEASTEGWAAGLKMAVLALQAQDRSAEEARQFWASFTGRNVYILDYLTEEVLSHLPSETQTFLIKTSILDRLNEALCAAVAFGEADIPSAHGILGQLERANLFLIPLDQERRWYRYHHLFTDLLRMRLQQQFRDQIPELHQRAAAWYEQAGWIDEAFQHSAAAQDWERAGRLVEIHGNTYLDQGQLATVLRWVEALPAEALRRRPNLCMQMAWALAHAGKTHVVGPLLKEAVAALAVWEQQKQGVVVNAPIVLTEQDATRIKGDLAVIRAYGLILAAQPGPALKLAEQALQNLPNMEVRELAWLNWVAGYAHRGLGHVAEATQYFLRAVEIGRGSGAVWEDHSTDLGIAYRLSGRLEDAAVVFEESLRAGEQTGLRNKGNLSRVEAYLSAVRMEQNRVEEGLAHARKAVHYLQWWPSHNHISTAYAFFGLALLSTGALEEAEQAINRAGQERRKGEVTPFVVRLTETARVRLWIARSDWQALEAWAKAQEVNIPGDPAAAPFNEYEEMRLIALARVRIAFARGAKTTPENHSGLLQQADQLCRALWASAEASKRVHACVEIALLGALADWELNHPAEALEWLMRSLKAGIPGGYRRVYLNEGNALHPLLRTWLEKDRRWVEASGVNPEAVRGLLEEMGQPAAEQTHPPAQTLVEPLTEREKDVLHLLALGMSNRDMAERLVVSEGTVKTHVHNIIGKLGAQSRMQVIARARELNLLD